MTISERARIKPGDMPEAERPISERYRLLAADYRTVKKAFKLKEEHKTRELAKITNDIQERAGGMPHNRAEMLAKCTDEWGLYLDELVECEVETDYIKHCLKALEIEHSEWMDAGANARRERQMGRQGA